MPGNPNPALTHSLNLISFRDARDSVVHLQGAGIQTRNSVLYIVDPLVLPVER